MKTFEVGYSPSSRSCTLSLEVCRLASFPSSSLSPTGELQLTFYARGRAALVQSNTRVAKPELISDKKSLFDTVPLLKLFLWPARDFTRLG
jgi:hypothetical protein